MKSAILSIGLLAAGSAYADEQKIEVKDLPRPVLAAVKAKFPEAKVTEASREEEDGKTVYELAIKDDDATIDLAVSAKGKILEVEKTIAPKKLPKAVTAALEAKYPKAKIKKAEEVVKYEDDEEEKKTFEVVMAAPGEEDVEVTLSRKGKILEPAAATSKAEKDEDDDEQDEKKGKAAKKEGKKKGKD